MKSKILPVCFILSYSFIFSQTQENRFAISEAESRAMEQPEMVAAPGPPDDGDPIPVSIDGHLVVLFLAGVGMIAGVQSQKRTS